MKPVKVQVKDLQLADVVQDVFNSTSWATMIVKQVGNDTVTFFRPYGVSENFSYTGGVICYTGVEVFTLPKVHGVEFLLLERKKLA